MVLGVDLHALVVSDSLTNIDEVYDGVNSHIVIW